MLIAAAALTVFLAVSTILPFLPLAHGIVRVGDFPRQQLLATALVVVAASLLLGGEGTGWRVIQIVLLVVALVQAWFILPFTPIWRRQSADFDPATDKGEELKLLACNVKMSNDRFSELEGEIRRQDPDMSC